MLRFHATSAALVGSGPPPDSPSSSSSGSSSSAGDEDKPACRMFGSKKHHDRDCPKLTANKRGKVMRISQHVGCVVARSTMRGIAQSLLPTSEVRRAILQGVVRVGVEAPAVTAQTRAHTGMLRRGGRWENLCGV